MKLWEICRFELAYQLRRPWPWLAFAVLVVFAFQFTRVGVVPVTLPREFILNSPFVIASVSVFCCLVWLLVASAIAGEAAARDVHTGMHPLAYTNPVSKLQYLGGRWLAAFLLNALVLLGVQVGSLLAAHAPGVAPEIIGPFRPEAYLAAYAFIALPNALIATTVQFAAALFSGRALAAYVGSVLLVFLAGPVALIVSFPLGRPDLGKLIDPIGIIGIMNAMMLEWTIAEKYVRMFTLEGAALHNRLLWTGVALATLVVMHWRFRFAHRAAVDPWQWVARRFGTRRARPEAAAPVRTTVAVPDAPQSFGPAMQLHQALSVAWSSFRSIARSPVGLFLLVAFPVGLMLLVPLESQHWGVGLIPRTDYVITEHLTGSVLAPANYWLLVPLLILYFAGDLVWRERDARLAETLDATAVPEWALLLGKYLGLALVLATLMAATAAAGMLAQLLMGHRDVRPGLYLQILFGLQLPEYLLFAALALLVHVVVNQKQLALLVSLLVYFVLVLSPRLGIEHNLLRYGAGPAWSYSDLRGMGASFLPWLWFRLYWAAWAILLGVAARLLWVRGREPGLAARLRIARRRLTGATVGVAAAGAALVLGLGGWIYYNTNVLNEYRGSAERVALQAEYERRYGRYEDAPQPRRTDTKLRVELHPDRGAVTVTGSYRLVNHHPVAIDTVHLATAANVATTITFDRATRRVVADEALHHEIHALERPLQPGDSLTLAFEVRHERRGFRHDGTGGPVVPNGTYFTSGLLPAIGYQPARELTSPDDRRAHGLPRQVTFPAPEDVDPELAAGPGTTFEAIVGTDEDQVAVAPGVLQRTWAEGGRRWFHYASDVPIGGLFVFLSADYAVHRERWNGVEISVFLDPRHTANLERVVRSARASLDYYTTHFGPYPHRFLQIVEQPGNFFGMGVDGSGVVTGGEGFFLLDPEDGEIDPVLAIVAHEMGHLWWGAQLQYAPAEGAIVLSEGLAWYSALQVVKQAEGPEQLRRLLRYFRQPYPWPPIRTGLPLLRAMDPWAGYRKGPYAMHALAEYAGEERVNGALASLLRQKAGPAPTPATTLDLYAELQAAVPDSLHYLLRDLFATNTFWELATERATAEQTEEGDWRVTLDVRARKMAYDSLGVETEVPMDEWVPIGVFAAAGPGAAELSAPLHLRMHRVRSGVQTITVTVPRRPDLAGIDPHHLLDWVEDEDDDNVAAVEVGSR